MPQTNIKIYLAISGSLVVLLVLIILIPFGKKAEPVNNPAIKPIPTTVETTNTGSPTLPVVAPTDGFTGVLEVTIPEKEANSTRQLQDLKSKVPLKLTTFSIDFDYGEYKFIVTLNKPKDQSQKEFESWRTANYPGLGAGQFLLK